jgi:short-subunit dehydrogenase
MNSENIIKFVDKGGILAKEGFRMGKIAVITGVSYGLGEAISKKLLELDFKVYGISRTQPKLQNDQFIWIKADLLNDSELNSIPQQISEQKVDLLVNNAGTAFLKKTLEYNDEDFEKMFALNFKIHAKVTKLFFPKLQGSLMINISSLGDRYPESTWGLYASSKAALNIFFEIMAEENKEVKIINILPTYVDTPMQHKLHDQTDFDWNLCMKPEDVANAIEYVVKNLEKIETGSRIIIDKNAEQNEEYRPEKLWVYSAINKKMKKIR